MAEYEELYNIITLAESGASDLKNKVAAALREQASIILNGDDSTDPPYDQAAGKHDDRVRLAARIVFGNIVQPFFELAVFATLSATIAQIIGASDTVIRGAIENVIDDLALAIKFEDTGT